MDFSQKKQDRNMHCRPSTLSLAQCRLWDGAHSSGWASLHWHVFLPAYCPSGKGIGGELGADPRAFLPSNYVSHFILQTYHDENITKHLTKMKVVASRGELHSHDCDGAIPGGIFHRNALREKICKVPGVHWQPRGKAEQNPRVHGHKNKCPRSKNILNYFN